MACQFHRRLGQIFQMSSFGLTYAKVVFGSVKDGGSFLCALQIHSTLVGEIIEHIRSTHRLRTLNKNGDIVSFFYFSFLCQ
jgi:hypothetical protein